LGARPAPYDGSMPAPRADDAPADVPIRPAATVIVVRAPESGSGLEVLLLRRAADLAFHGGSWVFPGGRVEPEDYPPGQPEDHDGAARIAAAREAFEEAAVQVDADALVPWAHWTTPPGRSRRFSTWFFLGEALAEFSEVTVDGGEISEHAWLRPADALAARDRGEVELPAPTFVSLLRLSRFESVADAMARVPREPYLRFTPRPVAHGKEFVSIYEGDVLFGNDRTDLDEPGPRHRLWMTAPTWRYENTLPG
jgi:8-oxo-dGTP pyrophosphatase MutT (NUDIX family)